MSEENYKESCIEMNNEEISYKMSIPMFEDGELERFDNNIHSIIEEYSKMQLHKKDQILTQWIIMKQEQEIERLNNIIKHTDSWIDRTIEIIKQQPSEDDTWILERLNGIKKCLKGKW